MGKQQQSINRNAATHQKSIIFTARNVISRCDCSITEPRSGKYDLSPQLDKGALPEYKGDFGWFIDTKAGVRFDQ